MDIIKMVMSSRSEKIRVLRLLMIFRWIVAIVYWGSNYQMDIVGTSYLLCCAGARGFCE
jgi:hypothetical protein